MASKITKKDLSSELNELLDKISDYISTESELRKEVEELRKQIPTKLSELKNDTEFITSENECIKSKAPLENPKFIGEVTINGKSDIAYIDNIPTKLSELKNDTEFITSENECIKSKAPLENPKFIGDLTVNNFRVAKVKDIPTKISQLENDSKFINADDRSITKKANKAVSGFNSSINSLSPYPFDVTGDAKKAAGITFDRGKYRVNFGIDVDNKLKVGGGTLGETYEIINTNNILETLFEKGFYLLSIDRQGKIVVLNRNSQFRLVYNEITKIFSLEKIV